MESNPGETHPQADSAPVARDASFQPLVIPPGDVSGSLLHMTARCMDAAALTVALAGADGESVAAAFEPAARHRLLTALGSLRSGRTRPERVRSLAAAGLRLLVPPRASLAAGDEVGARFIAAWARSLDPSDREGFVRGLGAAALTSLRLALPLAPSFDPAQRSTATHLIHLAHRALGRPPRLPEWSSLLEALSLRGGLDDPGLLRAARVVRMSPRAPACLALAAAVCAR